MGSGKNELLCSLQSCLADVQHFIIDAERREFDTISYDYASRVLSEIEVALSLCVEKARGL